MCLILHIFLFFLSSYVKSAVLQQVHLGKTVIGQILLAAPLFKLTQLDNQLWPLTGTLIANVWIKRMKKQKQKLGVLNLLCNKGLILLLLLLLLIVLPDMTEIRDSSREAWDLPHPVIWAKFTIIIIIFIIKNVQVKRVHY